jgi:predicted  nucleic acid-binding Zn-ribbon protein
MPDAIELLIELSGIDSRLREKSDLDAALRETLQTRADALRKQIPARLITAYDRAGRRPPLALVIEGTCSSCNLRVPPQLANEVRHGAELRSCPHCRRLFYASQERTEKRGHVDKRGGT